MISDLNGTTNICIIGNVITLQITLRNIIPENNTLVRYNVTRSSNHFVIYELSIYKNNLKSDCKIFFLLQQKIGFNVKEKRWSACL